MECSYNPSNFNLSTLSKIKRILSDVFMKHLFGETTFEFYQYYLGWVGRGQFSGPNTTSSSVKGAETYRENLVRWVSGFHKLCTDCFSFFFLFCVSKMFGKDPIGCLFRVVGTEQILTFIRGHWGSVEKKTYVKGNRWRFIFLIVYVTDDKYMGEM